VDLNVGFVVVAEKVDVEIAASGVLEVEVVKEEEKDDCGCHEEESVTAHVSIEEYSVVEGLRVEAAGTFALLFAFVRI